MTKHILFVAFLLISASFSWSQTRAEIDLYIAKKGVYLSIQEASKKDKNLEKALTLIQNWIILHDQETTNFYTNLEGFSLSNDQMSVPLYHIDGFKKAYQIDHQNHEESNGNQPCMPLTWNNGNLLIDLRTMKIITYQVWE